MERRRGGFGKICTGRRTLLPNTADMNLESKQLIFGPSTSTATALEPPQPFPETAQISEYNVRIPKESARVHNLMRFNVALNVDFSKWASVRIQREDNLRFSKAPGFQETEMPKFGAGSEYGREQREQARRQKYGMYKWKHIRENQPWILKAETGESSKKFKGLREGGVNENASYFIFTQGQDGSFEAFPIKEWYNFTPIQRYKALSVEEAEEQFSKRSKILNLFSVMVQKRTRESKDDDAEDEKACTASRNSVMKLTDIDDVVEEMEDDEDDTRSENDDTGKTDKSRKMKTKNKNYEDLHDSENSDDGDEEGREQDYSSDISSEDEEGEGKQPYFPGIDQDDNLRSLLESESSCDEVEKQEETKETEETQILPADEQKKKLNKNKYRNRRSETSSPDVSPLLDLSPTKDGVNSKQDTSYEENKVKAVDSLPLNQQLNIKIRGAPDTPSSSSSKESKMNLPLSVLQLAASEGITEEAVKKYLSRKPMTIPELIQKFKPKKSKISSQDMESILAHILKKLNPIKRSFPNKNSPSFVINIMDQ